VIEEIKFFFNTGFSGDEFTFSDGYKAKVLSKDKSQIKASQMFLVEMEAIEQDDIVLYDKLRQY
jgi:hypothetical protein